ncbi:MAG: DUF58 domain-containing protein [Proteobacteria bacterium]|nr:DUF58 domain-containing protein [Pseudomonadota bacterium]
MPLFDDEFLKKIEYLYVVSKRMFKGRLRAERKTKKVASGIEFADYRNYAPGDDFRALDWRLYARTEKLLVRLFEEKEELSIYFLIDTSSSMKFHDEVKLNYAKKMAAALGFIGLCNQDRVSFIAFNEKVLDRLPPTSGRGQIFKVFNFLEKLKGVGATSFEDSFKTFASENRRRGVAVVLSDFYNPGGYEKALSFLHYQQFETYVVHISDESEFDPKVHGDVSLVDEETGERLDLTMTPRLVSKYKKAFDALCLQMESWCVSHRMLYFRTPVSVPFDEIVLKVFRAGGFLK